MMGADGTGDGAALLGLPESQTELDVSMNPIRVSNWSARQSCMVESRFGKTVLKHIIFS